MPKKKNRFNSVLGFKKTLIFGLAAIVLASGAIYYYLDRKPPTRRISDGSTINLSPATEEEKKETEAHKDDIAKKGSSERSPDTSPPPKTTTGKKQVVPIITQADADSIRSYVSGVFEDGGVCTAKFTPASSSQTVTRTSKGFENVSYTSCEPISPNLSPGMWTVEVSYSSSSAEGKSKAVEFEVK